MIYEMKIPRLNVNEDSVKLADWYVEEGGYIEKGSPLCAVETSKALVEIEAEVSGYVKLFSYEVGNDIPFNERICYIVDKLERKISVDSKKEKADIPRGLGRDISATLKAKRAAEELGVDLLRISKKGVIRKKDVEEFYESKQSKDKEVLSDRRVEGKIISEEFFERLSNDRAFKELSSAEKIALYKSNGASIGKDVYIEEGALIKAGKISISDGAFIGLGTYIEADEVRIGRMARIGEDCRLLSGYIEIGDLTIIANRAVFDLSGGKCKSSKVVIGKQSLIAREVYLNSSRGIEIADRVALSPRSSVYTHSFWQSVLEGYSASFNGVTIDDDVWIGAGAQLLPGTKVGKGSIVMSNSLVASHVDSYTMIGGVPANLIKKGLKKELPLSSKRKILSSLIEEFAEFLKEKGCKIDVNRAAEKIEYLIDVDIPKIKREYRIIFVLNYDSVDLSDKDAVYIGLEFKKHPKNSTVFDVAKKQIFGEENIITDELRNFLRRRGITFSPIYWHYDYKKGL